MGQKSIITLPSSPLVLGRLVLWTYLKSCAVSRWLLNYFRYLLAFLHVVFRALSTLDLTDSVFLHSRPELACLSTPFANRAPMKKWRPSPSHWSNHGRSFWVIIASSFLLFFFKLLPCVSQCGPLTGDSLCHPIPSTLIIPRKGVAHCVKRSVTVLCSYSFNDIQHCLLWH